MGMSSTMNPDREILLSVYNAGLEAYRKQNWQEAEEAFRSYLVESNWDGLSQIYLDRIAVLSRETPPGTDWDGVWRMASK